MTRPDTFVAWIDCAECGAETEFPLTKREAAFYDCLQPVHFRCNACGGERAGDVARQAPIIDAELLEEWLLDPELRFDDDEDQSLAFLETDTLVMFASRPDGRATARRALIFALVEKIRLGAFETPEDRILARSFLLERLKVWAAPEPGDPPPRRARRRAGLDALYLTPE